MMKKIILLFVISILVTVGCTQEKAIPFRGSDSMVVEVYVYDELNKPIKDADIRSSCKSVGSTWSQSTWRHGGPTDEKGHFTIPMLKKEGSCTIDVSIADVSKSTQFNLEEYSSPLSFTLPIKTEDIPKEK